MPRNDARLTAWSATLGRATDPSLLARVRAALDDDLDTPMALAVIDGAAAQGCDVGDAAALLGVDLRR
jgi:L-cysteine:1D-myo-inositol 2-amino-2-deoxy-alpha-D-glucopyranoside ligase